MERYVVIDTGLDGCALLVETKESGEPIPKEAFFFRSDIWSDGINPRNLKSILDRWDVSDYYVERVPIIPHNTKSMCKQFFTIGQIWGVLMVSDEDVSLTDFYPRTWQSHARRYLEPSERKLATKKQAQMLSERYFPEFFKLHKKRSNIHDGLADCLSMLLYVERRYFSQFVEED